MYAFPDAHTILKYSLPDELLIREIQCLYCLLARPLELCIITLSRGIELELNEICEMRLITTLESTSKLHFPRSHRINFRFLSTYCLRLFPGYLRTTERKQATEEFPKLISDCQLADSYHPDFQQLSFQKKMHAYFNFGTRKRTRLGYLYSPPPLSKASLLFLFTASHWNHSDAFS